MSSVPVSFEYFPPKTEEQSKTFWRTHGRLQALSPEYCSVTFGAGGSTLSSTTSTVLALAKNGGPPVAPHLSCQGGSVAEIDELLDSYAAAGIDRIVALRGDIPSGMAAGGDFRYAEDLVAHIRKSRGDQFSISVACYPEFHPESSSPHTELKYFKRKVSAGADGAITQYFFNADAYFRFVDEAARAGIDVPIVPGIMPITNYVQLKRFSNMCGAEIPRWLDQRLSAYRDDKESLLLLGQSVVSELCHRLIEGGAPALHFYTLNRARATLALCEDLGVQRTADAVV